MFTTPEGSLFRAVISLLQDIYALILNVELFLPSFAPLILALSFVAFMDMSSGPANQTSQYFDRPGPAHFDRANVGFPTLLLYALPLCSFLYLLDAAGSKKRFILLSGWHF